MLRPGLRVTVKLSDKPVPTSDFAARYDYTFHYRRRRVTMPFLQTWAGSIYGSPDPCEFLEYAVDVANQHAYGGSWGASIDSKAIGATLWSGLARLFGDSHLDVMSGPEGSAAAWCRGMREL